MQGKKKWAISGAVTNSFTVSRQATVLDYGRIMFYIENIGQNSGGGGSGCVYILQGTPNYEDSAIRWFTIYSGSAIYSGDQRMFILDRNPWDAVRFQTINFKSGQVAQVKAYINRGA